jgi:hypothetical protein
VVVRDGPGEGFDFSVTVAGDVFGFGLGLTVVRGGFCVVVVRCVLAVDGVTVLPGVVTASEETVVVVVVVSVLPLIFLRT